MSLKEKAYILEKIYYQERHPDFSKGLLCLIIGSGCLFIGTLMMISVLTETFMVGEKEMIGVILFYLTGIPLFIFGAKMFRKSKGVYRLYTPYGIYLLKNKKLIGEIIWEQLSKFEVLEQLIRINRGDTWHNLKYVIDLEFQEVDSSFDFGEFKWTFYNYDSIVKHLRPIVACYPAIIHELNHNGSIQYVKKAQQLSELIKKDLGFSNEK